MVDNYKLYVLALEDNKYYVGITRNIDKRLEQHKNKHGSAHFTWRNNVREIIYFEELPTHNKDKAEEYEDNMTIDLMILFGIQNVRGGKYYQASYYDMINAMDPEVFNHVQSSNTTSKKYPALDMGLELLKKGYNAPDNLSTYKLWPTKLYYEKTISKEPIKNTVKEPKVGMIVRHTTYGVGKIINIKEGLIYIEFNSLGKKSFNYDLCVDKGLLEER